jgi:hypothetical protein
MAGSGCAPDHIRWFPFLLKIGGRFIRAMSSFAIDLGKQKSYSLIAPRGGSTQIIENKQLAISKWQIAGKNQKPGTATLCLLGLGLGLGLGHPRETQA